MSEQKKKQISEQNGPSRDPKKAFCEELVAAREALKLNLVEVSERTKINVQYLKKLETGHWKFLPHTYIRSFIRTYSTMLGMEVGTVLEQFDEITGVPPTPRPHVASQDEAVEVLHRPKYGSSYGSGGGFTRFLEAVRSGGFGSPLYWGAGILIAAVLVFFIYFYPRKPAGEEVKEIPLSEIVAEQTHSENEIPNPAAVPTETPRSGKRVVLEAIPTDRCYIRVSADRVDNVIDDVVLIKGFNRTYEADSLLIVVLGNAAGMTLKLNGEQVPSLGERGRVITATFGPEGLRHLRRGVLKQRGQTGTPPAPPAQPDDSAAVRTDNNPADEGLESNVSQPTDHGDSLSRD